MLRKTESLLKDRPLMFDPKSYELSITQTTEEEVLDDREDDGRLALTRNGLI
jgi:hypothetical protein